MKKAWKYLLLILLLLLLDQGMKLTMDRLYSADGDPMQTVGVHLHPELNGENLLQAQARAEQTGLPTPFWIALNVAEKGILALFALFFVCFAYVAMKTANIRAYPRLAGFITVFTLAAALCGILDDLFWGGSLDWFCVSRMVRVSDERHDIAHFIFDLKDVYLLLVVIAAILFFLLTCVGMTRFGKDKDAEAAWKKAFPVHLKAFLRHPIRYITGGTS